MRRKQRVLHLITRLELGGAQQNTLYCVTHHDRERFEVALIAGSGGLLDERAREVADATVELVPYLKHPIRPLWDLVALFRLRGWIKRQRVDLVHTHSSKAGLLGRLAAFLAGVPSIVHTVHGWSFNDAQPPWIRALYVALERALATVTDRLIVVSEANRERGLERGIGRPHQYRVIHSGIDVAAFLKPARDRETVRRELGVAAGELLVGTVACLKPQKAPLDFVRTAALALEQDPQLRFVIVGDGRLRPEVDALVGELGLESRLRCLGWRTDVADLLHAMDVFLLTSLFEGLPRVVLQAMAAGLPVVATAVDGTPEVVHHGTSGLLIPAGRPERAAEGLLEMTRSEALRRRCIEGARGVLDRSFEIRQMVWDVERVYVELAL